MKAMLLLSGDISARSPNQVSLSIFGSNTAKGSPDFLIPVAVSLGVVICGLVFPEPRLLIK
jgi:hypothetical protein